MNMKTIRFRNWKIILNEQTGFYDLYLPEDAEVFSSKDLHKYCSSEMEDIPTIEEAKQFIRNY